MAAAAIWPVAAGFAARSAAGTVVYSAAAPGRSNPISPNTSSPSRHPLPPGPAPATTPEPGWGAGTLSYRRLAGSALKARMACIVSGALFMAIFLTVAGQAKCRCAASAERGTLSGIDDPASRDLDGPQVAACQQQQSRSPAPGAAAPVSHLQPSAAGRTRTPGTDPGHTARPELASAIQQ